MKFLSVVLLMAIFASPSHGWSKEWADVVSSVKDAVSRITSLKDVLELAKNIVAGVPVKFALPMLDKMCDKLAKSGDIKVPGINEMYLQLRTACTNHTEPFLRAEKLWNSPNFDPSKKVVIFAAGWLNTISESDAISALSKAYNCRGDVNFVAVDVASLGDSFYNWAALDTEVIGKFLAQGLVKLSRVVPVKNIHLIGHSLGAHVVGAAASYFYEETGQMIPRVTGLDPAKPCFKETSRLAGLQLSDAAFIDVIHSNPGVLGQKNALGHVDFYPDGLDPLPHGCLLVGCAHSRAWEYYVESVYPHNEQNFKGTRCGSMEDLRGEKCTGNEATMGYAVEHTLKGLVFVKTNSESPYGNNAKYSDSYLRNECGKCV